MFRGVVSYLRMSSLVILKCSSTIYSCAPIVGVVAAFATEHAQALPLVTTDHMSDHRLPVRSEHIVGSSIHFISSCLSSHTVVDDYAHT